jgi:hypothetical protein
MVFRLKAGRTTRRTRHYSTCSLCWTRCALQATSDVYSVSVVTHDLGRSSPHRHCRKCLHLALAVFVQVPVRIIAIHQSRSHIHCQSFHNFIAHLRLRLDANMRGACFIAHMCTCIPSFLGFSETNILPQFLVLRHIMLQPTNIRGLCMTFWTKYGTRERITPIER